MNPAALFAAHKTAVLGVAAAGVAGLALVKRKSSGSAPAAAATLPASVAADGFMGPDSSAYDMYNALQPELEAILQTVGTGVGGVPAPSPSSGIIQGDNFHSAPPVRKLPPQSSVRPRGPWLIPNPQPAPPAPPRRPWVRA